VTFAGPRSVIAPLLSLCFVVFFVLASVPIAATLWVLRLSNGLPDEHAMSRLGEMDQATAIFDGSDQWHSRSSRSQRIEVPIAEVSPHLVHALLGDRGSAVLRASRLRSAAHDLGGDRQHPPSPRGAGRQHDHAAAGAPELPRSRQDVPPRKIQELLLAQRIEQMYTKPQILELVCEQGVLRRRPVRRRSGPSPRYFGKHASDLQIPEAPCWPAW